MAIIAAYQHDVTDEAGDLLSNVTVRVVSEGDGALPQLYAGPDTATDTALGNPYVQADGKVYFHVAGGTYKITFSAAGHADRVLRHVPIGRAQGTDLTTSSPKGAWSAVATYAAGDLVAHTGNTLFISLANGNINNEPDATTPGDTASWMYVGTAAMAAGVQWREGGWVTATAYGINDLVSEGGSSYICIVSHTSGTFATDLAAAKWELVAQKGDQGIQGPQGDQGIQGIQGVPGAAGEPLICVVQDTGGIVVGTYPVVRSYHGAATMGHIYAELLVGTGDVLFYVHQNGSPVYGPVTVNDSAPIDLADLGLTLAADDAVDIVVESAAATALYLLVQMDGNI